MAVVNCPICSSPRIGGCRCSGPHTLEALQRGHGSTCVNGHHWSGELSYDPKEKVAGIRADIRAAEAATDRTPTQAQIRANNAKKGTVEWNGLKIRIENPRGSWRSGVSKSGKPWSTQLVNAYGHLCMSRHPRSAADGDGIDIFIGDHPEVALVGVVDQFVNAKWDEHKCVIGTQDEEDTRRTYLANFQKGWKGCHHVTMLTAEQFRSWVDNGDTSKPLQGQKMESFHKEASAAPPDKLQGPMLQHLQLLSQSPPPVQQKVLQDLQTIEAPVKTPTMKQVVTDQVNPFNTPLAQRPQDWTNPTGLQDFRSSIKDLATNPSKAVQGFTNPVTPKEKWQNRVLNAPVNAGFSNQVFQVLSTNLNKKSSAEPVPLPALNPQWTGPSAIEHALANLDLDAIEAESKDILQRRLKSKRPQAAERLGFIDGLRKANLQPKDLMLSRVPVIPPMFRPFSVTGDTFVPGDANELYRDLMNLRQSYQELAPRLGEPFASEARTRLYGAVKAVYGHGEPVVPKTAERGVSGFLKQVTGVSPKFCYDDQTEILTSNGWKFFADCKADDWVRTCHPKTHKLSWEYPQAWVNYRQVGTMVEITTPRGSLVVTEGHTMWVHNHQGWVKRLASELVWDFKGHHLAELVDPLTNDTEDQPMLPGYEVTDCRTIPYDGSVQCCSTHSGLVVVRRHGFVTISGNSFLQRKLISHDQDYSGRGAATLDPELSLDEIGIPEHMAWTLYAPYIQRRLVRSGLRPEEALQHVTDRSSFASRQLDLELKERPVMYSRAPAWHKFNTLGGWAKRIPGDSVMVNPLIGTGQGLDHDGDTLNVHVVSTPDAVEDVKHKIMPSKMLYSIKERDAIVPVPKHEYILGVYGAQTGAPKANHQFGTQAQALAAINSGAIRLSDEITITGEKVANAVAPLTLQEFVGSLPPC